MKIFVSSSGERKINIRIPTRLLVNYFTATISANILAKHVPESTVSKQNLRRFVKELNRIRKKHPRLKLIDVESKDGEIVQITL